MSPVSRLLSHVSCRMSHVSCLLSHFSCLTSLVSCNISCLMSHASHLLSHVPCLLSHVYCLNFWSETFFLAKLPKRNTFLAKRSETYEAKRSETKRNFWFVVSRNWSETKRNRFCFAKFRFEAKHFLKRNWDTLSQYLCHRIINDRMEKYKSYIVFISK